jgi:TolA-binding protein
MKIKTHKPSALFLLLLILLLTSGNFAQQSSENNDFLYARRLYDDGMVELAAKQFRAFMENYPMSPRAPEALFMAGEAYFKTELYEEARQAWLEMTVRFPQAAKNDEAQFKIGDCFKAQKKFNEAGEAYHRVQVFFPKSTLAPGALVAAARMFTQVGNFSQALNMYFSFLNDYPEDGQLLQARLEVVQLLREKGELQRALNEADKLTAFAYKGQIKNQTIFEKGRILEEMGRLDDAQQAYSELTQSPLENELAAKVNLRLGYIYRLKGNWTQSNEHFLKGLQAKGESTTQMEIILMLGDNYFDLKQLAAAQENYLKVVEQIAKTEPRYFEALYKSGLTFELLADYKNANKYYFQLLNEYTPTNREGARYREQAFLRVAQNNLRLKDATSAISYFRKYLELYPESNLVDQIQFKIGQIYADQLRNPEKAIQIFERFLEAFPHSNYIDEAQAEIARGHEATGNFEAALNAWQHFLHAYPGGHEYHRAEFRAEQLRTYYLKDLNNGVNSLSRVLGNFLANQSTTQTLLELANLNFEQLKNYRQALDYYQQALRLGAVQMEKGKLYFRIGQCYARLAGISEAPEKAALSDSARETFNLVAGHYAESDWADDAAIELADWVRADEKIEACTQMLRQFPNSPRQDYMLFQLGSELMHRNSGTDSVQTPVYYFQALISQFPESPWRCRAEFQNGRYLYHSGDYFGAEQALATFLTRCPEDGAVVAARFYYANVLKHQEKYQQSIEAYQTILNNYFYSAYADSALLNLGDVLLDRGEYQTALSHFLEMKAQYHKISWSNYDQARAELFAPDELEFKIAAAFEKLNDLPNAREFYQNYLKMAPNGTHVPQALLALGKISSAAGTEDTAVALSYLNRIRAESGDQTLNYAASIQTADLLFQEAKYEPANQEYRRAIGLAADQKEKEYPQVRSIICQYRVGNIAAADNEVAEFTKTYGNSPQYVAQFEYEKGEFYLQQKSYDTAEKIFSDLRKKYKQTEFAPKAELALGQLYIRTNKDEKAMDIITQIPEKYPESEVTPLAYINLGDYYLKEAKQPENATSLYKKALEHPKVGKWDKYAMQNLIDSYEMLGMHDQVLTFIRAHLQKYPNDEANFGLKLKIGGTYKAMRQYDLAIAQFEELKKASGQENDADIQFRLAECYELMGQFEKAITEYLKVKYITKRTDELPWDVTAQYRAGLIYVKLKQYNEARTLFEKIVKSWGAESDFGRAAMGQLDAIKNLE